MAKSRICSKRNSKDFTKVNSWGDNSNDSCISWYEHIFFLNLIYITFFDRMWTPYIIYISYSWKNWSTLCTKNYDFAVKAWQGDRSQVRKLLLKEIVIFSKEIIYFFPQISNEVIEETLIFTCQIILWKNIIETIWFLPVIASFEKKLSKKLWFLSVKLSFERK